MTSHYDELVSRIRDIYDLKFAEALLGWDQQTYMPPKGNDERSRQMSLLSALAHERMCDPRLGELIDTLGADASLNADQKCMVREAKRDRDKAVKVPTPLVREISETAGKAHAIWAGARKDNDFSKFAPILSRLVELKKQEAEHIGYPAGGVPYDALLDAFEPGATVKNLTPIIARTRDIVVPAVKAIAEAKRKPTKEIITRSFPEAEQEKFGMLVIEEMGYDLQAGRLDRSVHPFTTSFGGNDVRITTRYEEHWLPGSLFGTIHECGHALYEQGLNKDEYGTPLGEAVSLGIHESQSRFWENQIGRSLPFWKHFYPKLKEMFPAALDGVALEDFHFAVNNVEPSLIRVEADEVTYNLHIVVRYEVEQAMFSGEAKTADLPALWNDKYEKYLGVRPKTNAEGILQDIHWSFGGFGYFPTYLLGNLYSAQWMATLKKEFSVLDDMIAHGEFTVIREWLKDKIHRHGRRFTPAQLAKQVSGEDLNPDYFGKYLKEKYGALYGVTW